MGRKELEDYAEQNKYMYIEVSEKTEAILICSSEEDCGGSIESKGLREGSR